MIIQELIHLGLTEKEAKVYVALLELGQESVQQIAVKASVNRATTYFILDSLMKRGLASKVQKDEIIYFSPESPSHLINVLKKQEADIQQKIKNFENILPHLRGIFSLSEHKPVVRYFEGKEGLNAIRRDFLEIYDKEMNVIFSHEEVDKVFSKIENQLYRAERKRRNILVKGIYISKNNTIQNDQYTFLVKIPYEQFPITSDITIYGNKVAIASLKGYLSGVIIENEEITKTLRSVFRLAFAKAKDLQNM